MRKSLFVLASLLALLVIGCQPENSRPVAKNGGVQPSLLLLAIDNSQSTTRLRSRFLVSAHEFAIATSDSGWNLRMYRFGRRVEEVAAGSVLDEDALASLMKSDIAPSDQARGTDYPGMLQMLASVAHDPQAARIKIVVVGDGFNDFHDHMSLSNYNQAAKDLSENSKVERIIFWGVQTGARAEIRQLFKGRDKKLQILGTEQDLEP